MPSRSLPMICCSCFANKSLSLVYPDALSWLLPSLYPCPIVLRIDQYRPTQMTFADGDKVTFKQSSSLRSFNKQHWFFIWTTRHWFLSLTHACRAWFNLILVYRDALCLFSQLAKHAVACDAHSTHTRPGARFCRYYAVRTNK